MQEIRRERPAAAAAAAGRGELGAPELIPPDRRLPRAAVCFQALGFCIIMYSAVPNHDSAASWELVFAGFFVFILGAALALFTLGAVGGAVAGHADDARVE